MKAQLKNVGWYDLVWLPAIAEAIVLKLDETVPLCVCNVHQMEHFTFVNHIALRRLV